MTQDGKITFTVNVKNIGNRNGAEVVQLYIHDVKASVDRPYKELKGFQKVALNVGESKDVDITIDRNALSFWDVKTNGWTAESGDFTALVGNSSDNLPLKATFTLQ
jgi:beta-glucosidase